MNGSRGAVLALALGLLCPSACHRDADTIGRPSEAIRGQPASSEASRSVRSSATTARPRPVSSLPVDVDLRAPLPRGLPPVRVPADNLLTNEKIALGRRLFYDTRLSGNGRFACATCHQQRRAFTDGRPRAIGSTGERHARSTMSLTNVAYNASFGWADSSVQTLEQQMAMPLFNEHPIEMGLSGRTDQVLARFANEDDLARFRAAFPGNPVASLDNIVKAIAAFERTLVSGDSPLDRYLYRDDRAALSASALRGMELFFSDRIRCAACHAGFNLSGPVTFEGSPGVALAFHNTGLLSAPEQAVADRGLFDRTRRPEDRGSFRAPTLRNIAVTAPYMHDGSLPTLEAVVAHYASGGNPVPHKSKLLRPFRLSSSEAADLVAFLQSLTDEAFLANPDFADPASAGGQ